MSQLQLAIKVSRRIQLTVKSLEVDALFNPFSAALKDALDQILPMLEDMQDSDEHEHSDSVDDSNGRFPALADILEDTGSATTAIQALAQGTCRKQQRMQLVDDIKYCLPRVSRDDTEVAVPSFGDLQELNGIPLKCDRELITLHSTLSTFCLCQTPGTKNSKIPARVRLRNERGDNDDTDISFGVLFMAHPHQSMSPLDGRAWWQDTKICLRRAVHFEMDDNPERAELQPNSGDSFCNYISNQHFNGASLLRFSVTNRRLYYEAFGYSERQWLIHQPSVALDQLLEKLSQSTDQMDDKQKNVLSWLLARAVWQYYTSPWMTQPWRKNDVHFLGEHLRKQVAQQKQDVGIYVNEPLLSIEISSDTLNREQPNLPLPSMLRLRHKVPKILDLGVMLLEIQLGRPIESLYTDNEFSTHCPGGEPNLNTNYLICKDLIRRPDFFDCIADPLEDLIRKCVEPKDTFVPPHIRNEEDIQNALGYLVNRLEAFMNKAKPDTVQPLYWPSSVTSVPSMPLSRPPKRPSSPGPGYCCDSLQPTKRRAIHNEGRTLGKAREDTKGWFERIRSLNYILDNPDSREYQKVRIAVLDTGVRSTDNVACDISGYKDFVSGNDNHMCDISGHGTTSLRLIFQMCAPANVYAVRVFETDEANKGTRALAIEAIEWCIKEQMDIICMACGFYEFDEDLFNKIQEASRKLLIFAASTNDGNAKDVTYPAKHYEDVFGMFSTTGRVTSSRHNPTELPPGYHFAILGENIMTCSNEENSGTSYSTAIAAGLAARLLDFSRQPEWQDQIKRKNMMKLKNGMSKVFLNMSISDRDFLCLKPWRLLPRPMRNNVPFGCEIPPREDKKEARQRICQTICECLDNL